MSQLSTEKYNYYGASGDLYEFMDFIGLDRKLLTSKFTECIFNLAPIYLTEKQNLIFTLYYKNGLSIVNIKYFTNSKSLNDVNKCLIRAKEKMKDKLVK